MNLSLPLALCLLALPALADVRVLDGDSLRLDGVTYRIAGIDAPERGEPGYQSARMALERLAGSGVVVCTPTGEKPTHGRTVAICRAGGLDMGREMIRLGLAHYCRGRRVDYSDVPEGLENKRKPYCRK